MNALAVLFEIIAVAFVGGIGFGFALAKSSQKIDFKMLQRQIDDIKQDLKRSKTEMMENEKN